MLNDDTATIKQEKRNPRGGVQDTLERGAEKVRLTLEWIYIFHFTTLPVLAQRLKISENTTFRLVQKLKRKKLICGVAASQMRREILLLTPDGVAIASQLLDRFFVCPVELEKINLNRFRHDLYVQKAVIVRLKDDDVFSSDHQLQYDRRHKIPDALIESWGQRVALEIELTAKTDERIYIAFERLVKALYENVYEKVEYIFQTKGAMEYYKKRFEAKAWPVYVYDEICKQWIQRKEFADGDTNNTLYYYPRDDEDVIQRFSFSVMEE